MTTTMRATATKPAGMTSLRKTALVAGIFYLITFISIPTLALYGPVKNHRDWILSSGTNTGVLVGCFLEVIVALAGIGTAVTLYPVVKRQNEGVALGFVTARLLEASMIFVGVISVLGIYTLRQDLGGTDAVGLTTTTDALIAVKNWTFLLGPGVMAGVNDLILGYILYRSGLVPRPMAIIGLVGGPLILLSDVATILGAWGQVSAAGFLFGLPVAVFEFSVGVYLTVKGFRAAGLAALDARSGSTREAVAVA